MEDEECEEGSKEVDVPVDDLPLRKRSEGNERMLGRERLGRERVGWRKVREWCRCRWRGIC